MVELYDPNSGLLDLIERCRYLTKQKQVFQRFIEQFIKMFYT